MFDFLSKKFSSIFSSLGNSGKLTEKNIQDALIQVKDALLEADVPYSLVETFTNEVQKEVVGQKIIASLKPDEHFLKVVNDKIIEFFGGEKSIQFSFELPSVVMVMGLQGSGKTTTIGKLAHWVQKEAQKKGKRRRILLGSVDFYRPAAIDQLEMLAQKACVDFYRAKDNDPVKAAQELFEKFKEGQYELLFIDTAGRLHVDNAMLQELQSIDMHLSPKYKILVLDAMTGQESLAVARAFDQAVGFKSAILTKMDSDTRGGAAFSFRYELKKPILFIGKGEKLEDLTLFHPERVASRMLGMGDIKTLIEHADEKIKKHEQDQMYKSFKAGSITLEDFGKQMDMMGRLGSMSQVMKYIPGMNAQMSPEMIQKGELEMKKFRAIISSMTPKERLAPAILNSSRKIRIAKGAGVHVSQVNLLLQRFEHAKQYVKLLKKLGPFKGLFR